MFEAVRDYGGRTAVSVRFYQAGSSEMFGAAKPSQSEATAFYPRSPYAVSKVAAHYYTVTYREGYGLFACNGILFNHESLRRGETFMTRKITGSLWRIKAGTQKTLGNLDAKRDSGSAGDCVRAMWMMLQQDVPDDYVVGTGEAHSVCEFLDIAAERLHLDWEKYVESDPSTVR